MDARSAVSFLGLEMSPNQLGSTALDQGSVKKFYKGHTTLPQVFKGQSVCVSLSLFLSPPTFPLSPISFSPHPYLKGFVCNESALQLQCKSNHEVYVNSCAMLVIDSGSELHLENDSLTPTQEPFTLCLPEIAAGLWGVLGIKPRTFFLHVKHGFCHSITMVITSCPEEPLRTQQNY